MSATTMGSRGRSIPRRRFACGCDAEKHGRRIARAVGFSAGENFRAFGDGVVDKLLDALHGAGINQAAELGIGAERVADLQRTALCRELLREFLGHGFFDDDALGGHANLPLVHEGAEIGGVDCGIDIGIAENDDRGLSTQL